MSEVDTLSLILAMDERGIAPSEVETRREALVPLGAAMLDVAEPAYHRLSQWRARNALVYTAIKFARRYPAARQLGAKALSDKSDAVRSTACALLAFGLDRESIPALETLAARDCRSAEDAEAAIRAIRAGNHHLYMDRRNTGRVRWNVLGAPE